jgi:uncharacterized membrane protein YfcA
MASVYFLSRGVVDLPIALLMAVGAIAGGLAGGALARRVQPALVRAVVVVIGLGLTAVLVYRRWLAG